MIVLLYAIDLSFMYFNGRELFIADASLFVDDAEAHEKYHRQEEPEASAEKVYLTDWDCVASA